MVHRQLLATFRVKDWQCITGSLVACSPKAHPCTSRAPKRRLRDAQLTFSADAQHSI